MESNPIKESRHHPFEYETHIWGAKKRAAFLGGLPLLLPDSYRWIDQLITTNLVSHPVTCVIDRYIHIYVCQIIVLGWEGILLNKYS